MKKLLAVVGTLLWGLYACLGPTMTPMAAWAQNTTCSDRPAGDSSNACANTRFVQNNGGGGINCILFTSGSKGCVPASGGGTINFLRADGTWAQPPGSVPIGGVIAWSGATVPPGFLLAFGQAISRSTFDQLFGVITFNPTVNCTIGNPTVSVAIGTTDRVPVGAPIEGTACFSAGTTVLSKGSGTLTMTTNAIATTATSMRIFPYGNGDGSTTYNLPNLMGRVIAGRDNMSGSAAGVLTSTYYGASPDSVNVAGGSQSTTLSTPNLPAYTPSGSVTAAGTVSITDPGHTHTISNLETFVSPTGFPGISSGGVAASLAFTGTAATNSATTGITATFNSSGSTFTGAAQGGSATPFSTIQPALTMDYIIKAFDVDATVANLVVGVTTITGGSNNTVLYDNGGILGELAFATLADMYAGTAPLKIVAPAVIWPPEVVVTFGSTTTFDMSLFRDAVITLTGNITTMTLTNPTVGKSGSITFVQDATGSRTTVFDSKFKFAGGVAPTLTTTANAIDILNYQCRTSTFCFAAMMNDVK